MPIEPKFVPICVRHVMHSSIVLRGRSIMTRSVGLLIATVLAVGLVCAPASAQTDDDDDDKRGTFIPIAIFSIGSTKSSLKGNFRDLSQRGPRVHSPGVRPNAAPWPGRRAIAGQAQMMRTGRPLLHPAGARHVGLGRRF